MSAARSHSSSWARESQPVLYFQYSIFAAEVASNFNQAMVRAYLLETTEDKTLKIALMEEAMANYYRYFFIMPTLARFELGTHERIERGEGLNAEGMIELMAELFEEPYGSEMALDRERVGITWAQFNHRYDRNASCNQKLFRSLLDALARMQNDIVGPGEFGPST